MEKKPEYVVTQRRIPEEEKKTAKWYVLHLMSLNGTSFRHKANGKIYTVKRQYHPNIKESPILLTTEGKKFLLEDCLADVEINLSEVIKAREK